MNEERLLVAVGGDPGGTTGICAMGVKPETIFGDMPYAGMEILAYQQCEAEDEEAHADALVAACVLASAWTDDPIPLVMEQFALRKFIRSPELLSPERINALVKVKVKEAPIEIRLFWQMPTDAKRTITNQRLKDWGLYIRGREHARDAERHAIYFIRRAKKIEMLRREAWWPR